MSNSVYIMSLYNDSYHNLLIYNALHRFPKIIFHSKRTEVRQT